MTDAERYERAVAEQDRLRRRAVIARVAAGLDAVGGSDLASYCFKYSREKLGDAAPVGPAEVIALDRRRNGGRNAA